MKCFYSLIITLLCIPFATTAEEDAIDQMVLKTMQEWQVPGLALSIVHKGEVVKADGYGVRVRGESGVVDGETVFQICSLSKAFTSCLLNMFVTEGKLLWEEPIIQRWPTFRLLDPVAQAQVTLRDLLSHRTGLPGLSLESWRLWWHTGRSAEDLIARLAFLPPAFPLRAHFTYNNLAYVVAAHLAEKIMGASWETMSHERIFSPLGMERTNFSYYFLTHDDNVAAPHKVENIRKAPIEWQNSENLAAAMGINSCAKDMAAWLKYCLQGHAVQRFTCTPQTLVEVEGMLGSSYDSLWRVMIHGAPVANYGLGWMSYTLNEREVYFHMGLGDGMQSMLVMIPQEELAVSVLTNQAIHSGCACLINRLIDHFLLLPAIDWTEEVHKTLEQIGKEIHEERETLEKSRKVYLKSTLPLAGYIGIYHHPAWGDVEVTIHEGQLLANFFGTTVATLIHWQGDSFEMTQVEDAPEPIWLMEFLFDADGVHLTGCYVAPFGVFEKSSIDNNTD